jgi:hypothetical protein
MKIISALTLTLGIAPTAVLAHGQADHSVAGTLSHYLMDIAHISLFWGGLILAATVISGLVITARYPSQIKVRR